MNKVIKNYFYNASYQILLVVLPIIVTPYISRVLGASGVGTYNYTNSITQFFMVFGCIGLSLYGQREVAYYQNDIKKRSIVFFEILFMRAISLSVSLIIFYLCFVVNFRYSNIFAIQMIDIISYIFDVSWFFQGMEEFKKIVLRNFVIRIICVAAIFIFVKNPSDLSIYVFIYSFTLLAGNLSLWFYLPKYVNRVNLRKIHLKKHIKPTLTIFLPQVASTVYSLLDKTMIEIITESTEEVAYYSQSQMIIRTIAEVINSLGTTLMPRIAYLYKSGNKDEVKKYMNASIRFVLAFATAFAFGIMAVSQNFVPWFFGDGFDKVIPNLMILSPILILMGMTGILGTQYLVAIGRQKQYAIAIISAAIVNFGLNIVFIHFFASCGAALASILAECTSCLVMIFFLKNDFNFFEVFKAFLKYIVFGLIMMSFVILIGNKLTASILNTFVLVIIGASIYIILLIISKDSIISFVLNGIKNKVKS